MKYEFAYRMNLCWKHVIIPRLTAILANLSDDYDLTFTSTEMVFTCATFEDCVVIERRVNEIMSETEWSPHKLAFNVAPGDASWFGKLASDVARLPISDYKLEGYPKPDDTLDVLCTFMREADLYSFKSWLSKSASSSLK